MGREDSLEKELETHSSILAWEIPQTEKLGGLESLRQGLRYNLATEQQQHVFCEDHRRKQNSHHIISRDHIISMIYDFYGKLGRLAAVAFVRFPHWKVTLFHPHYVGF